MFGNMSPARKGILLSVIGGIATLVGGVLTAKGTGGIMSAEMVDAMNSTMEIPEIGDQDDQLGIGA